MKVGFDNSRLESLMINNALKLAFAAICFLLVTESPSCFSTTATAAPVLQDMDKSELEQMILKRIEEKRKENEAKKKSGEASKSSASRVNSFQKPVVKESTTRKTTPRVNATRPGTAEKANGSIPRARREAGEAQLTEETDMRGPINSKVDPDVKILFSFENDEWKDVIEFFASQAGFGVYYGQTGPPQGTFTYADSIERSIIESLDFLNSRLSVLQPPHVLVRNGSQLVLVNESLPYPDQLIALIAPDELPNFGEYEVASCLFNLGKLTTGAKLAEELRSEVSQVHLDGFSYSESTNTLQIRERARVLRRIHSQINSVIGIKKEPHVYEVVASDADTLLNIMRPLMGIADKQTGYDDGSLSFASDPLGTVVYLFGTRERIDDFLKLAATIDVAPADDNGIIETPYFQSHRISGSDPAVVFQILQNILDGEPNIKMDQDANNGTIYLEAPKRIHDKVTDFLANLTPGESFTVIALKNLTPSDAKSKIEELLGIDTFDPPEGSARIVADTDFDSLMVYGTPSQILSIKKMVAEIDEYSSGSSSVRRPLRMIPMSPRRQEEVMKALQIDGIMEIKGRRNTLNVIMPEDRMKPRGGIRYERRRSENQEPQGGGDSFKGSSGTTTSVFKPKRSYYVNSTVQPRQEEEQLGQVSTPRQDEQGATSDASMLDNYAPADEIPSVPGAPIEVRMTERGLLIKSYDLDAADDLEDLIEELFDPDSEYQRPTVIALEHRDVEEAKSILNYFLGLESSSSGGGGGGIGGGLQNMLGGAVKNAVGGAAGDALGSFFGGGGGFDDSSDGAGAIELEGEDVRISTDVRFNTLIVTGATGNDIDRILELVEYIDQSGPPQRPKTLGQTYEIAIKFRDPMEIKDLVQAQYPDYFRQAAAQGGNNQGNARQQLENQVARQLQAAMQGNRGNRRGGNRSGGANNNSDKPKATLGVDETQRLLLITGPEFIYDEVYSLVKKLDVQPDVLTTPPIPVPGATSNLAQLLRQTLGDSVTITTSEEMEEEGGASGGTSARPGNTGSTSARRGGSSSANATRQNLQREIMNRLNSNRGRNGRPGGGTGLGGRGR